MTFPNGASAIESTLKCEIKDQQILEIKDGVSERYTSYTDDLAMGLFVTIFAMKFSCNVLARALSSGLFSEASNKP